MPPHGWRTMFWVVDQSGRVLVGPRERVPEDGTQRSIVVNGAEVGKVIASPVERLTRNTDINFDRQQRAESDLVDRRGGKRTVAGRHIKDSDIQKRAATSAPPEVQEGIAVAEANLRADQTISVAANFIRSTTDPRTSATVIAAKVIWKLMKTYSGISTPSVKVAAWLEAVTPDRKNLPQEMKALPSGPKARP